MDTKQQIIAALRAFVNQRSGIEFANYGDVSAFRAEQRSITKDRKQALELLSAIEWRDSITAKQIVEASKSAFSGRLTITLRDDGNVAVYYCTGQYFPTEYRRAVAAVCATALWRHVADHCMPAPKYRATFENGTRTYAMEKEQAEAYIAKHADEEGRGYLEQDFNGKRPGDWLRDHFRQEFGRGIASRWFQ
jgi:hypothetical protein